MTDTTTLHYNDHRMSVDPCIIATVLMTALPAVLAQATGKSSPGHEDFMAAIGTAPATAIVLLYCREKGRSLLVTASAFFSCGAFGLIIPGAVMWTWFPQAAQTARWNVWAVLGLLFALMAHFAIAGGLSWLDKYMPGLVKKGIESQLPPSLRPGDDPK